MTDSYGSSDPPNRTRPLTWAVVVCVVVYNAYLLIRSVHSELWGWIIPFLVVWFSIPVAAVYAFKRLHLFMTGDRDRQYPAGDQLIRALLIGGVIQLAGVAMRYEPPKVTEEPVRKSTRPYQVPAKAPLGSTASLAEYVSRCALTPGEHGLVLQTSDGGLHVMDLRSGALVSPPPDPSVSFEALTSANAWSASEVRYLPEENRVVHMRDPKQQVDLGPLDLRYIGPAAAPEHFFAFHPTAGEFRRLDLATGQTVWRLAFDRQNPPTVPSTEVLSLLNPKNGWSLMTYAFDRTVGYLLLIDDPDLLTAAGMDATEATKPQWVFLDSVIPSSMAKPRIRELMQIPGTPSFLMTADVSHADAAYERFRLQYTQGKLEFVSETVVPKGARLIRSSFKGPGPAWSHSGKEIVLEAAGHPTWRPLDPEWHHPSIAGFSAALEHDVLLPSPIQGRLDLIRVGQGHLPGVAEFPGRSFSRDRHCVVRSADERLVAIALGSELRVLFKAGQGGVDAVRQWRIELPIDAQAAINGAILR